MPKSAFDSGGAAGDASDTLASSFVDGGEIKIAKLVSTSLGALWLTVLAGWWAIVSAIVRVNIMVIDTAASGYAGIVRAVYGNSAETYQYAWSAAFRGAVEASPMLAPVIMSLEIIVISAIAISVKRRLAG